MTSIICHCFEGFVCVIPVGCHCGLDHFLSINHVDIGISGDCIQNDQKGTFRNSRRGFQFDQMDSVFYEGRSFTKGRRMRSTIVIINCL